MVVSIIGGSGSGKDTQAEFISQKFHTPHLSMGQILREGERNANPLAIEAQKIANQGKWAPDNLTSRLLQEYVETNCKDGFVLTGYPRFIEQVSSFDKILADLNLELNCVIHIRVPDEILLARMQKQRDEAMISNDSRSDTSDDAIKQRLQSYHDTIQPLLVEYSKRNLLIDIDGTPSKKEVFKEVLKDMAKYGIN